MFHQRDDSESLRATLQLLPLKVEYQEYTFRNTVENARLCFMTEFNLNKYGQEKGKDYMLNEFN